MDTVLPPGASGVMAGLIRSRDWAATPLGAAAGWPQPLRTLLDVLLGSNQPMFVAWGEEHRLLYNDAYAQILGGKHPAALGEPLAEVWHEVRGDLLAAVARLRAGEPVRTEGFALTIERNGFREEAQFAASCTPVRDEGGAVAGFFCVCQEITGHAQAERRLRQGEARAREEAERVRLAHDAAAILGTWTWDVPADRFAADERFARSFGLDPEACRRGLPVAEVIAAIHPGDAEVEVRAMNDALARGGPYRREYRVAGQGGGWRWIEASGRVDLGEDGRPLRFTGVLIDIEARRATEAERDRARTLLETFAQAVPGVVYAKDREGRMLVANRGTTELIGKPPEAYLGRTDAEFLEDEAQARAIMATDRRIMESGAAEQVEESVTLPDGRPAVWLSTKAPLRDEEGAVVGLIGSSIDITARKAVEAALQESEATLRETTRRFDAILNNTREAVFLMDRHQHCIYANAAAERLTGYRFERMQGRTLHEVVHHTKPDGSHYPIEDCPIDRAFPARAQTNGEELFVALDGSFYPVAFTASPVLNDAGEPVGTVIEARGIAEEKARDAALRESEERFRFALDAAEGIGTWDWDIAADCVHTSEQFARMYGVDPERARGGLPVEEYVRSIHPGDRAEVARLIAQAVATGGEYRGEYRIQGRDGQVHWVIARGRCFADAEGRPIRFPGVTFDITARKAAEAALAESEARLRAVLEGAPVGLVFADATGRITGGNARVEEILAHPILPSESVADYGAWVSHHADGRRVAAEEYPLARVLSGEERAELETLYRRGDGREAWVRFIASAVRDTAGELLGGVVASVDIDRERRAEAGLRHLNETLGQRVAEAIAEREDAEAALRQAQKMEAVGQLTGGIAHDFNNMLAAVMGSLDLLDRRIGEGDARARRYVEGAMEGARRAAALTQRLLAFARQQPLRPEAVDLGRLIEGMSDLLQRSLGAAVRLETGLAPGLWPVHADPNQLENVLLNLAVNARDAMPEGGRLTIEAKNEEIGTGAGGPPPGAYVVIRVSDTGTGMTPEVMARAFEPFYTTKPVGRGTGLGLSQAYGFVAQSGGQVAIDSEPGRGTTVTLRLPRLDGPTAGAAPRVPARGRPRSKAGEVVLVAEDEAVVRRVTVEALGELGYRVIEADGAEAALRLLDAHPEVALLFTDVVMPETDGRRLAQEAQRRRPGLRVLFTTGFPRDAMAQEAPGTAGAGPGLHVLDKPFSLEALAWKLREALDGPAPEATASDA